MAVSYTHLDVYKRQLLERRNVDANGYLTIRYNLHASKDSSTLGQEVSLDSLPQYAHLAPEHTYSLPFGGLGMTYIRMPMVNNVDGSLDGVSVYEGAVQLIHNIYKNEYQLGREFELGRSRIVDVYKRQAPVRRAAKC